MNSIKKVCIASGGTGGHLFPALALARDLTLFADSFFCAVHLHNKAPLFADLPYPYFSVDGATPFTKNPKKFLKNVLSLVKGVVKSYRILRAERPALIIGFGSFHSFPPLMAAIALKIPIILFEPNLVVSRVNRLLSRRANLTAGIFTEISDQIQGSYQEVSFPIYHPKTFSKSEARKFYGLDPDLFTVLIFGGSQGARSINQRICEAIPIFAHQKIQVIHITGNDQCIKELRIAYNQYGVNAVLKKFERKMHIALTAADIAICRSGAATLAELIHFEIPALLVPFPQAIADHQSINANYFSERIQGGLVCKDGENISQSLQEILKRYHELRANLGDFKWQQSNISLANVVCAQLNINTSFYLIGIGGIGMSALALILLERGYKVYGSDQKKSEITTILAEKGVPIDYGKENLILNQNATVVYSTAITEEHPQFAQAKFRNLPLWHRSQLLDRIMKNQKPLLVTGAHGKTTTSALLSHVLIAAGLDPSYAIGGIPLFHRDHGHHGAGEYFVAEADESDGSFTRTPAHGAIITNVETDHLDFWKTEANLKAGYKTFIHQIQMSKFFLWYGDDPFLSKANLSGSSFGFGDSCNFRITQVSFMQAQTSFDLQWHAQKFSQIKIPLHGQHNVLNAAAVFGLCVQLGVQESEIRRGMASFKGVARRFEKKGVFRDSVTIYDDYAHHPTEIMTTLKALRQTHAENNIIAVMQPHRYSRLRELLNDFALSFIHADEVIITDVYSAGESEAMKIAPELLLEKIRLQSTVKVQYVNRNALEHFLAQSLTRGDVLITLGAGDINQLGTDLLRNA